MTKLGTKKIVLIALVAVIAISGIIWAIVASLKPTFRSGIDTVPGAYSVSGNGSAAVMVDNYLYFVGGYTKTSEIKYGDNDYYANGKIPTAGIYRVEVKDNQPVLNYEYDNTYEDGDKTLEYGPDDPEYNQMDNVTKITDWEDVTAKKSHIKAVVPKIAGHDQAAMWVFGNNLIYTTPHNLLNSTGVLLSNKLDFYCVNLDGTNHRLIYTSAADVTRSDFTLWANNTNNIYLLIKEGTTLKKIKVSDKKVTTIAEKVTAAAFPTATQYRTNANNERLAEIYGGVMSYVYYTTDRDTANQTGSGNGNLMYRYAIADNADAELIGDQTTDETSITYTPVVVTPFGTDNAQFVYTTKETRSGTEFAATKYCVATSDGNLTTKADFDALTGVNLAGSGSTIKIYANGFYTVDETLWRYDLGYVNQDRGKSITNQTNLGRTGVSNVFAVMGNTVYYQTSSSAVVITFAANGTTSGSGTTINLTATTDDDTGTTSTESALPLSALYQAYADGGAAGNNLVFLYDNGQLKLYSAVTTDVYAYLRR